MGMTYGGNMKPPDMVLDDLYMKGGKGVGLIRPDMRKVPIWRKRPTRLEAPIKAWRVWDVAEPGELENDPDVEKGRWYLTSAVMRDFIWRGPVARADRAPYDMKIWDEAKKSGDFDKRYNAGQVFQVTGIHALKSYEQALEVSFGYTAPVVGRITLWGRVARFEYGYRAEYCMIKSLKLRTSMLRTNFNRQVPVMQVVKDLEHIYQCEVVQLA